MDGDEKRVGPSTSIGDAPRPSTDRALKTSSALARWAARCRAAAGSTAASQAPSLSLARIRVRRKPTSLRRGSPSSSP